MTVCGRRRGTQNPRVASARPVTGVPAVGPVSASGDDLLTALLLDGTLPTRLVGDALVEPGNPHPGPAVVRGLVELHVRDQCLGPVVSDHPVQQHRRVARLGTDDAPAVQQGPEPLVATHPLAQLLEVTLGRLGEVPLDAEGAEQRGRCAEVEAEASGRWCGTSARRRGRRRTPARPAASSSAGSAGVRGRRSCRRSRPAAPAPAPRGRRARHRRRTTPSRRPDGPRAARRGGRRSRAVCRWTTGAPETAALPASSRSRLWSHFTASMGYADSTALTCSKTCSRTSGRERSSTSWWRWSSGIRSPAERIQSGCSRKRSESGLTISGSNQRPNCMPSPWTCSDQGSEALGPDGRVHLPVAETEPCRRAGRRTSRRRARTARPRSGRRGRRSRSAGRGRGRSRPPPRRSAPPAGGRGGLGRLRWWACQVAARPSRPSSAAATYTHGVE